MAFSWGTDLVCKGDSSSSNSNRSRNNGGNSEVDISSSSRGTDHNENATITEPTSESMDGIERRSRGLERLLDVDVVIASDVVYDPIGYEPLVKSLCELLGGKYIICAGIEIATEISTKIGPEVGTGEGTDTDTGAGAEPKIEFSVERGIEDEHPSYPICILAHRHRHPENQR